MKKFMITIMMVLIIFSTQGCNAMDSHRIVELANAMPAFSKHVDVLQAEVERMTTTLEEQGLIDANSVARTKAANEKLDEIQFQFLAFAETISDTKLTGDTLTDTIKFLQAGNVATAKTGLNPYAIPVGIVLTFLASGAEYLRRKEKEKRAQEEAKRRADKAGREKTLRELAAMDNAVITAELVKSKMFNNIGEARGRNG